MISSRTLRRPRFQVLVILLLSFVFVYYIQSRYDPELDRPTAENSGQHVPITKKEYASYEDSHDLSFLPSEYQDPPTMLDHCEALYGYLYLHMFCVSGAEYCTRNSRSRLTCFHYDIDQNGRTDSFCIGGPAYFDWHTKTFRFDCELKENTKAGLPDDVPSIRSMPRYWYGTGPRCIMDEAVVFDDAAGTASKPSSEKLPLTILIKREDVRMNMWHGLMEIMSTFLSLDVLRLTYNPQTNTPFFQPGDFKDTEVVILDRQDDGPYFDLWNLFAHKPVRRVTQLTEADEMSKRNVLLPLPGGSNPFWQGDWKPMNCTKSILLQGFSDRVLDFYKIPKPLKSPDDHIIVTFIDRTTKRKVLDQDIYLDLVRRRYASVELRVEDFADLSFIEQLRIVRETDILMGVHGAGLTHGMFLPPASTIVEILPYGLHHKGFMNMAVMLGHHYLSDYAVNNLEKTGGKGDWQNDDIYIGLDEFMLLIDNAITITKQLRSGIRSRPMS